MPGFDPSDDAFVRDPHAVYSAARAAVKAPWSDTLDGRLFTRYADVERVLRDPALFSSDDSRASRPRVRRVENPAGRNLVSSDPPAHTRLRRLLSQEFTPAAARCWQQRVETLTRELLDQRLVSGSLDVVADLAVPLVLRVAGELIGVPTARLGTLLSWSEAEIMAITPALDPALADQLRACSAQLHSYWGEAIAAARESAPTPSLLSRLAQGGMTRDEQLADEEIAAFLSLLLRAATHTTSNWIANSVHALLQHPDQLALLAEAPALEPAAVEELLRYASPVQAVYRIVTEPCELHGVSLRPGERVYAVIASANRDERQFEDPHELRLDRELGAQLGFGAGTHVCMGAFMARIELRVALGLLLERVPHPRCVIPLEHLAWRRTWAIRELERLPVRAG